jgi:biotin carboxyl carrier protein
MDVSELERLIALMQNASISELTLREGNSRVTLRKNRRILSTAMTAYEASGDSQGDYGMELDLTEPPPPAPPADTTVTAPLVGVFRHIKPMVGLGAKVKEGQKIGTIQAVKLLTDLTSPINGVIVDVFIEDGHPVEYGHTLFTIRPAEE